MPKKPKALDLAGWRRTRQEPDPRGGTRQLTQETLAARHGIAHETLCRIETGARWSARLLLRIWRGMDTTATYEEFEAAQLRTWRAYSPDRKGKTP